jgi:hypothetical protein
VAHIPVAAGCWLLAAGSVYPVDYTGNSLVVEVVEVVVRGYDSVGCVVAVAATVTS